MIPGDWLTFGVLLLLFGTVVVQLGYWWRKGVVFVVPTPIFGNFKESILGRNRDEDVVQKLYDKLEGEMFGGIFKSHKPMLLVRDPELVKHVLSKDFVAFPTRVEGYHKHLDPLSPQIFNYEGDMWRTARSLVTPTFTPGKVKSQFEMIQKYADNLTKHLSEFSNLGKPVEMKSILTKFSVDVLSQSLFDVQANALTCADSEFYRVASEINPSSENVLSRFFNHRGVSHFLVSLAKEILTFREENEFHPHDLIEGLASLRAYTPNSSEGMKVMAAHMFSLFHAGSRKPAAILACALHELGSNPDVQDRLYEEIDTAVRERSGLLTHQTIQTLPLLDNVIKETLRLHPAEPILSRVCRQPYTIPGTNVTLDEGTKVLIPVKALHRDPQYHAEPLVFNPDRFSEETEMLSCTYLPFGQGPRMCIGFRLGILVVKIGLCSLVQKFSFTTTNPSADPTRGAWLNISSR